MNGLLLIDKPNGLTSNAVLSRVKRLLLAKKGGHTGSLDPIATGLLPMCFGNTTRIAGLLLESNKTYEVVIRLGESTETGDTESPVVSRLPVEANIQAIEKALEFFRGRIRQVPPMYSAIKKQGKPLYKLARDNQVVERTSREVVVHNLKVLDFSNNRLFISLACSKGFYVRSLAMDLGRMLGCGGHVETLRRLKVGKYTVNEAVTLQELADMSTPEKRRERLIKTDQALDYLPKEEIPDDKSLAFCQGQSIPLNASGWKGLGLIYSSAGNFLGLGEWDEAGNIHPRKIFS